MNLPHWMQHPFLVFFIALIAGLFAAVIFYPYVRSRFIALVSYKKRKFFKYDLTVQQLLNHAIIAYLSLQQSGIRHLEFPDKQMEAHIKDMLNILFSTYKKAIKDFITQGVVITDKYAFKKLLESTILEMDKLCEAEWRKLNIPGIDTLIKNFHQHQRESTGFLNRAILHVATGDVYDNSIERIQEILSLLEVKFDMTIPDVHESFGVPTSTIPT